MINFHLSSKKRALISNSTWDYYISNAGLAGNTGHSPADPITFAKLQTLTLADNYTIKFKRGEVFELGNFTISYNSITITDFGAGSLPIFTGSTDIGGQTWTSEGGGIYSTPLTIAPKWVFVNGTMAKYAETGWIPITARPNSTTITVSSATLNLYGSLVGAKIWGKEYNFRMNWEYTITAENKATGVLTVNAAYTGAVTLPINIVGQQQLISEDGEWFYDSTSQKLFYKSSSTPAGTDIRVTSYDNGINIASGKTGVIIENIALKHYYKHGINGYKNDNLIVSNVEISQIRNIGIFLDYDSDNVSIEDCTIHDIGNVGMSLGPLKNSLVRNNTVYNICVASNMGLPTPDNWSRMTGTGIHINWENYNGGATTKKQPYNVEISYNRVYNVGYVGVFYMGNNHLLKKNVIHDFLQKLNDGGGFHSIHRTAVGVSTRNCLLQHNIVYNGLGSSEGISGTVTSNAAGIYIDNGSDNITVDSNLCFDNTFGGIMANWDTKESHITNNICARNGNFQISIRENTNVSASPVWQYNIGNTMTGNVMVCSYNGQYAFKADSLNFLTTYNPFAGGGNSESNHYVNPYNFITMNLSGSNGALSNIRSKYGTDALSTEYANFKTYVSAPQALIDVEVKKNETDSTVLITPTNPSKDYAGNAISSANVDGFYGVVFLKN
jgi:parallel beta-helix repeat protein